MNKRISIKILILFTASVILLSIIGLALMVHINSDPDKMPTVIINGRYDIDPVFMYQKTEDEYYLFLPSFTKNDLTTIDFTYPVRYMLTMDEGGNLSRFNNSDTIEALKYNTPYSFSLHNRHDDIIRNGTITLLKADSLPTVFLNTASGSMDHLDDSFDHSTHEKGSFTVLNADGSIDYTSDVPDIRGRGNSTWDEEIKKPYQITLPFEKSILGMSTTDKYLLLANSKDRSKICNSIVCGAAAHLGFPGSASMQYVEVYLNGKYNGLYQLSEKIIVGSSRLNITNLEEKNNFSDEKTSGSQFFYEQGTDGISEAAGVNAETSDDVDITGGYLLERNNGIRYSESISRFTVSQGDPYVIKSPAFSSKAEVEYIASLFQELTDRTDTGTDISDIADYKSFADMYILEEFFADEACGSTSAYYYKDSDLVDNHIYAGPAWDFDKCMGQSGIGVIDFRRGLNYLTANGSQTLLYYNLARKDRIFIETVKQEYYERFLPYVRTLIDEKVDEYYSYVTRDNTMDCIRWDIPPEKVAKDRLNILSYLEEKSAFMSECFEREEDVCIVHYNNIDGGRSPYMGILKGDRIEVMPQVKTPGVELLYWYDKETGDKIDEDYIVTKDMEIYPATEPVNN
ncbi:MAG: CotH kinase family protein [Lachnospiraceae bacterium]|nr:CotH kinase family protein [Lachnospiraceae bacterium]